MKFPRPQRGKYLPALAISFSLFLGLSAIGSAVIIRSSHQSIGQIDGVINQNTDSINSLPSKDSLTPVISIVKADFIQVTLGLRVSGQKTLVLSISPAALERELTAVEVNEAKSHAVTLNTGTTNRVRAVQFGDTGLVVLAASIESVRSTERTQFLFLIISTLLLAFLLYLLIIYLSNKRVLFETAANFSAEKRSREKIQAFLGDVSHELRTPLTVIKGYVELVNVKDDMPIADRKRHLTRVANEIIRMEELIRDLLQLAELGEAPVLEKEIIDISEIASGFIADARLLQPDRPIEANLPEHAELAASKKLISQVLSNVFQNARRHTPADAQIYIEVTESSDVIHILYEDAGPGVADEVLEDRSAGFFRFDKTRSREAGGSGLGLSLITAVIKAHDGTLLFGRSRWGGFKIDITLPKVTA